MCHMSVVTCHMSRVTCQVSQFFFFFFYKVLELVGGGSVIKGLLSIVKKNGSFSGAFLGAFDKYVENLCNFRELFQCFGSICKLYEEFFTNFENSTEILCYYLCCFQKTPEFRRFSKIWDPATALPWRCKILSTSRTQKTWCLVLFMLKKKNHFFLNIQQTIGLQKISSYMKSWIDSVCWTLMFVRTMSRHQKTLAKTA